MFEYFRTAFKVIVGVITNERLAIAGLICLGILAIWIIFSLIFSFQNKFSLRAREINEYISRNGLGEESKAGLLKLAEKMPSEFQRGLNNYLDGQTDKPSKFIKRFESLDVELSGGVFNQNKSFIKTYINFVFTSLLLFSIAFLGNEVSLTGYLIAEAAIIPLAFLLLAKVFYYVYTAIRQYQYRTAVDDFNDMLDNFDNAHKACKPATESKNEEVVAGSDVKDLLDRINNLLNERDVQKDIKGVEESKEEDMFSDIIVAPGFEDLADEEPSTEPENQKEAPSTLAEEIKKEEAPRQEINVPSEEEAEDEDVEEDDFDEEDEELKDDEPIEEDNEELAEEKDEADEEIAAPAETQKVGGKEETEADKKAKITDNFKVDINSFVSTSEGPETEVENEPVKRGRGRPKKEVNQSGEFVIKNDKDFEEALERAEKLMRKNEQPLSASQTKRIEKQIKELVDAMTKYKENK